MNLEGSCRDRRDRDVQFDALIARQENRVGSRAVGRNVVHTFRAVTRNHRVGHDILGVAGRGFDLNADLGGTSGYQRVDNLNHAVEDNRAGGQGESEVIPTDPATIIDERVSGDNVAVRLPFGVVGIVDQEAAKLLVEPTGAVVACWRLVAEVLSTLVDAMQYGSGRHDYAPIYLVCVGLVIRLPNRGLGLCLRWAVGILWHA